MMERYEVRLTFVDGRELVIQNVVTVACSAGGITLVCVADDKRYTTVNYSGIREYHAQIQAEEQTAS